MIGRKASVGDFLSPSSKGLVPWELFIYGFLYFTLAFLKCFYYCMHPRGLGGQPSKYTSTRINLSTPRIVL